MERDTIGMIVSGAHDASQLQPSLGMSRVAAILCRLFAGLHLLWICGAGTVPHTIKGSDWENETNRKLDAWPREAAGPVAMNPISRQNYNKA